MTSIRARATVLAASSALVLAACGGGADQNSGEEDGEGLTPVTVGTMPLADLAPFHHALSEGLF